MSKNLLKDIFIGLPDVAEKILDELMKVEGDDDDWMDLEEWHEDDSESWSDDDKTDVESALLEKEGKRSLVNILPLRLVCRDMKNIVDNYKKVWVAFDEDQPLLFPTLVGNVDIIQRLLDKGVDVNKRGAKHSWQSNDYWCPHWCHYYEPHLEFLPPLPLDLAARHGVLNSAKMLIEGGAVMIPNDAGAGFRNIPFHHAARNGHVPIMELLFKGISIDIRSWSYYTALHYAAQGGHRDAVEWLIGKGADVNLQNFLRMSPVDLALLYDREDIAELIGAHGGIEIGPKWRDVIENCEVCQNAQQTFMNDPVVRISRHLISSSGFSLLLTSEQEN